MNIVLQTSTIIAVIHLAIMLAIAIRVIMRRPARGVALAWLLLVSVFPIGGAVIYMLIGERRISPRRIREIDQLRIDYRRISNSEIPARLMEIDWSRHLPAAKGLDRVGRHLVGSPTVHGTRFTLLSDTQDILKAISRDIDGAQNSIMMEFYIWNEGGTADEIVEALIRAAARGVQCRVLVDALGSRPWWKCDQPQRLRDAGVQLVEALRVGVLRSVIGRADVRLHRKIIVVDGKIAWTGSMNLVDPRYFKQDAGVGEWVDAMVRLEGAAVVPLGIVMLGDWVLETGEAMHDAILSAGLHLARPEGEADIQVIPSGPGLTDDGLLQMLLGIINAAESEIVITTPYLVPDDSLILALRGAAARGVRVSIILPEKVDSLLTRYASRSYYDELLDIGVMIYLYRGGLLHTKSITTDRALSMFGTVNLDMRSLWLNYEVALFVYDAEFANALLALQQSYIAQSERLDPEAWRARSFGQRFMDNTLRLASPLL
ncbi:MAG: cardiolipin synthase [Hyphomicrobiales bacterium]